MPGRLFLTRPASELAALIGCDQTLAADLSGRRNVAPGQQVLVVAASGVSAMRWGMIPVGRVNARGRPVMETIVNARSETVFDKTAFQGVGRAIIPADGWYEWTGKARRKQPWRIRPGNGDLLGFAAITDRWQAPDGRQIDQVAAVTCAPNADVVEYHDRMGVLLDRDDWQRWLTGPEDEARRLLQPWPDGRLVVEKADDVDWSAP